MTTRRWSRRRRTTLRRATSSGRSVPRFETEFSLPPFSHYRSLRRVNPSPFLYYLDFDRFAVIGSSPEILVRCGTARFRSGPLRAPVAAASPPAEDPCPGGRAACRSKGTGRASHAARPRPQRRGPVAEIGSIKVTDRFILEYYSQVMHIVSMSRASWHRSMTRSMRWWPASQPAPYPARPRSGP